MGAGELTRRWAVALVGIPIVVGLLYRGGWTLALPLAVLAGMGARECYRFAEAKGTRPFAGLGVGTTVALVVLAAWRPTFVAFAPFALALLALVAAASLLLATFVRGVAGAPLAAVAVTIFGALYSGLSLACVPLIHALPVVQGWEGAGVDRWAGALAVTLPLASTWLGDAAAFFAGRAWGRSRLAPSVSPNKSWVGAWAGVIGAAAAGAMWYLVTVRRVPELPVPGPIVAAGVGALLGVGAIVGDLAESLLKREAGVKDSGAVFPGHGGVLDRLDALIFTLPIAYGALALLGGRP